MPGKVATKEEWLAARLALLEKEKELTRAGDAVAAQLRELPMVPVDKTYTFTGPEGQVTLKELFGKNSQLIIYHFMFNPDKDAPCRGCSFVGEHLPDVRHLDMKDTAFVCISRAPLEKLNAFKAKTGWKFPWYSSGEGDFNYDYHATLDEKVAPIEYNYRDQAALKARGLNWNMNGDQPGASVFKLQDGKVYHTYSTYGRGFEKILGTFFLLDLTPAGRQVDEMGPASFKWNFEYDEAATKA